MPFLQSDYAPFIERRDLALGGLLSALGIAAMTLPETAWPGFADRLARFKTARCGPLSAEERAMIAIVVGDKPADWIDEIYWPEALGHKYLSWMQILAGHAPRCWRPNAPLAGKDYVDQALELGRGVVLFTATFSYRDLMAKAAFAQAGYALSHLSRDTHGFSETRFGKRWLNPIYTSIEECYLRERLVFSGSNTKVVSATLRERLKENAPVMITVTPLGRRVETLPFLNGQIHIATGGLNFACENETPVLPVFTLRMSDGETTTFVGPALHQPEGAAPHEKIEAMLADYVPRLEKSVLCRPEQFLFPLSDQFGKPLISRLDHVVDHPRSSIVPKAAA